MSGRRKALTFAAGAALAVAMILPSTAAVAGPVEEDSESMTLVVEIPARTASPTPTPSSTPGASTPPAPDSSATPAPNNQAGAELPPTGGEALLWLLLVGGSVTAVGLVARRAARGRQSSTAPRS
jgi:uncharacterized surface anchored protein